MAFVNSPIVIPIMIPPRRIDTALPIISPDYLYVLSPDPY
jgi:hypothetical protein